MKKLLILTFSLLALASCEDYSKCPTAPYGVHDFQLVMPHSDYSSWSCRYCKLYYESPDKSDYINVQNPKTGNYFRARKQSLYPNYKNQYELK